MTIQYKCSIRCTSIDELNFNCHSIYIGNIYNQIINALQPDNIEYIHCINILTKKTTRWRNGREVPFMIKSIEFLITRLLEEEEFIGFIHKMKEAGFSSNTDNNIQLIHFSNASNVPIDPSVPSRNIYNILYDYIFSTEVPHHRRRRRRHQNNSSYGTHTIYKKQ
jgi:hypothetical protein